MRKSLITSMGGVTAAFAGSLCCAGPLLFVTLGVGAGLASTFEPLRPLFGAMMLGFFAFGFRGVYARRLADTAGSAATEGDDPGSSAYEKTCDPARRRNRDVIILWAAAVLALVLWTFPTWSQMLL